mgnify:CR=1 FL=1|jgi:XRE family transcriptional regulator, regulator of sulfur utilization
MSEIVRKVGQRITELRGQRHLTQAVLAERADLAPHTISRIERGEQAPSLDALSRIADALNIPVYVIFQAGKQIPDEELVQAVLRAAPQDSWELHQRIEKALRALIQDH